MTPPNGDPGADVTVRSQLDSACDAFERAWQTESTPRLEDYLSRCPPEYRWQLLRDLLDLELDYRQRRGSQPDPTEYLDRFPSDAECVRAAFAALGTQWNQAARSSTSAALADTQVGPRDPAAAGDFDDAAAASSSATDEPVSLPRAFGQYTAERILGKGGFGYVYLARDGQGQACAIKVLHSRLADQADIRAQFEQEAAILRQLSHPALVRFVELFTTSADELCLVTEYLPGGSLADNLDAGPWSPESAVAFVRPLADALHQLHLRGFTHRDVKPANILLDDQHRPRLADVGLALSDQAYGVGDRQVTGSMAYLSPEQARGDSHLVDGRTDIYSLGIVMYEMLTGRRPHSADEPSELLRRIQSIAIKPPRQINPAVPRDLEAICLKATHKDASERYATADDFAAALRGVGGPRAILRSPAVVAGLAALLVVVGLWAAFRSAPQPAETTGEDAALAGAGTALQVNADGAAAPDGSEPAVGTGDDTLPALEVRSFEVLASRDGSRFVPARRLMPLQSGDAIRFSAELTAPAYVRLYWVDAHGVIQEFYPREPTGNLRETGPVLRVESPASTLEGWEPLDPAGFSESAFLVVSREPLTDLQLPSAASSAGGTVLNDVLHWEASSGSPPRLVNARNETRGAGGNVRRVSDVVLELMEALSPQVDSVHAIRIPMVWSGEAAGAGEIE